MTASCPSPKSTLIADWKTSLLSKVIFFSKIVELDGLNLPTLFNEAEDFTNIGYDSNDFKYSKKINEHGEVLADTFWSPPDPRDMLVRDEHGCLMSVFDVYTVSTIYSPYKLWTEMSAHPTHHRGARPKTTVPTPQVRYACVACSFKDFKTAHSLRRHMIQVHNISCDTLVQGRPFSHIGHVMRRPSTSGKRTEGKQLHASENQKNYR